MKLRLWMTTSLLAGALCAPAAMAEVDPYIGQVSIVAGSYCPRDWAEANGQTLSIFSNTTLFALYGCTFGGNCQTTFNLPDLRGRSPVNFNYNLPLGVFGGFEDETLNLFTMPSHSHRLMASSTAATEPTPGGNDLGEFVGGSIPGYSSLAPNPSVALASGVVGTTGAASPSSFPIRQPSLGMRFCVALDGVFPPRN